MANKKQQREEISFPARLLSPIKNFLEAEIVKWKKAEKNVKINDPFTDEYRTIHNSDESDTDEQIGHFEAEVKVDFIKKQLVQLRKALAKIKGGKYGICEKCGKMIDTDRLSIKPETTVCINCARDQE